MVIRQKSTIFLNKMINRTVFSGIIGRRAVGFRWYQIETRCFMIKNAFIIRDILSNLMPDVELNGDKSHNTLIIKLR